MDAITIKPVTTEPIVKLLSEAAPNLVTELNEMFGRLNPKFVADTETEELVFNATPGINQILIGMKCTVRLQAHAVAAGLVYSGLVSNALERIDKEEMKRRFGLADQMLNWAVGRDLFQHLKFDPTIAAQLGGVFKGSTEQLAPPIMGQVDKQSKGFADNYFYFASAFILLHELAHLELKHVFKDGFWSLQQERDADWFALDWLLKGNNGQRRTIALYGAAVALIWLTMQNIFIGENKNDKRPVTHPKSYDRLFQNLDRAIGLSRTPEYGFVWDFVRQMLFIHMAAAKFEFDPTEFQSDDPRQEVVMLIDKISRRTAS